MVETKQGYAWRCCECDGADCVARVMREHTIRQQRVNRDDVHTPGDSQVWVEIICSSCFAFEQEWSKDGVDFWQSKLNE